MPASRTRSVGTVLRSKWTLVVAGGAAVALIGGGATAAFASTPTATTAAVSSAHCTAPGVARLLRALPDSLKTDLKTLRHDSKSAKAAERAVIKQKALAGGYGVEIEQVANAVAGKGGKLVSALPAALKADLGTLRADPKGSSARATEAAAIWSKAVGGSYGATIEGLAKDAKAKIAARCAASATTQG